MRLYLDDDSASALLARLLRQAGHDVQAPIDVGMDGEDDPVHLAHAIHDDRACLTGNHHDFENLHDLIMEARGHHPGIFVVRRDNNPKRDLTVPGVVRAVSKFLASGMAAVDQFIVLDHWR